MSSYIHKGSVHQKITVSDSDSGSNIIMFQWEIKVTQYECDELIAPKLDCLQYHTSPSGDLNSILKSFYDGKVKLSVFLKFNITLQEMHVSCRLAESPNFKLSILSSSLYLSISKSFFISER